MITPTNSFSKHGTFSGSIRYYFILSLSIGFLLSGCGGGDEDDPAPNNPNTPGSTADITAPKITNVDPENGASNVPIDVAINFTFSEPLDINTIKSGSLVLSGGASSNLAWNFNMTGSSAILTPDSDLQYNTEYTVRLTTDVADLAGNNLAQAFTTKFTTMAQPDNTPPTVVNTSPTEGRDRFGLDSKITIDFSEPLASSYISPNYFSLTYNGGSTEVDVSQSGSTVTLDPINGLRGGPTSYTLEISSEVADAAGNKLGSTYTLAFSTENQNFRPTDFSPSENVPINGAELSQSFMNSIDASTVTSSNIRLVRASNAADVNVTLRVNGNTIYVTPQEELREYGTYYILRFSGGINGIRDVRGNTLSSGDHSASFLTEPVSVDYDYRIIAYTGSNFSHLTAGVSNSSYYLYKDIYFGSATQHWYFEKAGDNYIIGNRNALANGDDFLIEGTTPGDGHNAILMARPSPGSAYAGQVWIFENVDPYGGGDWFYFLNHYWDGYLNNSTGHIDTEIIANPDQSNQWKFVRVQ